MEGLISWERSEHMKKILFVDDKEKVRELISITLGNQYQTFQAESGEKAVEIAKTEIPDLIIMDIMMPGEIDGLEATRILKKDPKTGHCKILILSAKGQTSDITSGIKAGANEYIVKPFNPTFLVTKIEELLGM